LPELNAGKGSSGPDPQYGPKFKEGVCEYNRMARSLQVSPRAARKPSTIGAGPSLAQIQQRAYEIFLERRGAPGDELEDWLRAERELAANVEAKPRKSARSPTSKAA
jgi:hypothetical protein